MRAPGLHVPLVSGLLALGEDNRRRPRLTSFWKAWDPRSGTSVAQPKDSVTPGNDIQAKYRNLSQQRLAAMRAILWDEEKGAWFDYDLENGKKNLEFYPSNLTPLWSVSLTQTPWTRP